MTLPIHKIIEQHGDFIHFIKWEDGKSGSGKVYRWSRMIGYDEELGIRKINL